MKTLKEIRNELGLSQKAMAVLLGISRNKLALAEQGSEELPPRAMDYLEKIDIALSQTGYWEATDKEIEFYRAALEHLLRQAKGRQKALVKKLQALVRLHVLDYFAGDFEIVNPYSPLVHEATYHQAIDLEKQLLEYDRKLNRVNLEIEGIQSELRKLPDA